MSDLLTLNDLARMLGLSINTLYQRRYRGDDLPPSIKVGNTIRYRRDDVERWLDEHIEAGTR